MRADGGRDHRADHRRDEERGTPFQGVLFLGLMVTAEGPKLIEYNVRFGDPECQVLMMRLKSDLLDLLEASATGDIPGVVPEWRDEAALTVVMATKGYPGPYSQGLGDRGRGARTIPTYRCSRRERPSAMGVCSPPGGES